MRKNPNKTSVNVSEALAALYGNSGSQMKKAVLSVKPSYIGEKELKKLYCQYGVKNLEELKSVILPNYITRNCTNNVKLHISEGEKKLIILISGETEFTKAFNKLLLIDSARKTTPEKVSEAITQYYNQFVIPFASEYDKTSKKESGTELYVLGNKEWFLEEYRKILLDLPREVNTLIEPFMGSGIVTLDSCRQNRFKKIITNDIWWQKVNYVRALFNEIDKLKTACLSQTPDSNTYTKANNYIQNCGNLRSDKIYPRIAAKYFLKKYCEDYRGKPRDNRIIEYNPNATANYMKHLDSFWDVPLCCKNVIIHNEDASDIIRRYDRKNNLLFVDPPYIYTKGYEKPFSIQQFEDLVKAVLNFNGYFIFCCRITESHEKKYPKTYSAKDMRVKGKIDSLFFKHRLYYKDFAFDIKNFAFERVITNFPFNGCMDYDTALPHSAP